MMLVFKLSGEHPSLPLAELEGVLKGEEVDYKIVGYDKEKRIVRVEAQTEDAGFAKRLALSRYAIEYVSPVDDTARLLESIRQRFRPGTTFRVRSKSKTTEERLGGLINAEGYIVDLDEPQFEIHADDGHVGYNIGVGTGFKSRRPQHRPYFHPTSMHPKIARTLVNLAQVRKGDTIADPFCGTGGILIEAGLMGLRPIGRDIDERMAEGSLRNLAFYNVKADVKTGDALEYTGKADAIVTDPPYGRASYTSSRNVFSLYDRFLENMRGNLDDWSSLIIVTPKEYEPKDCGYEIAAYYDVRVHKSLTRRIWHLRLSD